ncbi:MAG TPA: 1,2-phenylacetyl-CoA epoxidase subunit PaaE [Stellaceae bacterium]|jgi:ring-1,2-phenylacetyl-CoA epoxidase subunit PaaE|nr:1,2-phenylacetyl-CoA epoxidase subunit PaaE [Stellaceae bacterium]
MVGARFHSLAIADLRRETADCLSIAFAVPEKLRAAFRFRPGQYLTLRATLDGADIRRCYSICSGLDDGELRVAVKRVPGGVFSAVAEHLKPGDTLDAMPPQGRFTTALKASAGRNYVAIAAGSGITPILSLIRSVLAREPKSRCFLLYGNRTGRDIIFAEELARLKDRHLDRFSVTHVLSREAQDVPALNGRLDPAHIRRLLPALVPVAAIDRAFLCGPEAMMDAAAATLAELGLARDRILREYFLAGEGGHAAPPVEIAASPAAATTASIVIDGRSHDIPVPDGASVIDAALAAGLDLPYSCRAGMCCTCRARLVDGKAEMAVNYSLQQWEIDAGFILTCQARPLTSRLTLDYDAV